MSAETEQYRQEPPTTHVGEQSAAWAKVRRVGLLSELLAGWSWWEGTQASDQARAALRAFFEDEANDVDELATLVRRMRALGGDTVPTVPQLRAQLDDIRGSARRTAINSAREALAPAIAAESEAEQLEGEQ